MVNSASLPDQAIDQLCEVKKSYVDETLRWFRTHQTLPAILFRLAGVTVIVLSLALPFLAAAGGEFAARGVPIAAFLVAAAAALNSFFQWQGTWQKRLNIQLALEGWIAIWETKLLEARRQDDPRQGYRLALEATQDLIEKTRSIQVTETALLFSKTMFPEPITGKEKSGGPSTP